MGGFGDSCRISRRAESRESDYSDVQSHTGNLRMFQSMKQQSFRVNSGLGCLSHDPGNY